MLNLRENEMNSNNDTRSNIRDNLEVLLVVCSMTQERYDIAKKVIESISSFFQDTNCRLLVIDNGSKFKIDLENYPQGTVLINFDNNIGYWGALHWFLNSQSSPISKKNKKYLYIVESDHIHFDMFKLKVVEFLETNSEINCVRVQEFSVRNRFMYSKEARYLPFRKLRSIVSLRNHVTNKKSKFLRSSEGSQIYFTNLHSRLPSVFRFEILRLAFQMLAKFDNFTEKDFYEVMHTFSQTIGILDGGIFYSLSSYSNSHKIQSGSWGKNYFGSMTNYIPTRVSSISNEDLSTKISSIFVK